MPQICHIPKLLDMYLWLNMPIYIPNMKLLPSIMQPESLYTDNEEEDAGDATAQLDILGWPPGQVSQKIINCTSFTMPLP